MKTRTSRASFIAVGVAVFVVLSIALPQAAQSQAADIAILRAKVANTDSTIERIDKRLDLMDKRFERMDKRLDRMDERLGSVEKSVIRLDEKTNSLQSQSTLIVRVLIAVFVPLHLVTIAALFALLTKGHLWGFDRSPNASGVSRRGRQAQPAAVAS